MFRMLSRYVKMFSGTWNCKGMFVIRSPQPRWKTNMNIAKCPRRAARAVVVWSRGTGTQVELKTQFEKQISAFQYHEPISSSRRFQHGLTEFNLSTFYQLAPAL